MSHPTTVTTPARQLVDARERAIRCARVASDNRGRDIEILDMRQLVRWVDYMIVVTGTSRRQIITMADEIEASLEELNEEKKSAQGHDLGAWVVLDYEDILVHIFDDEKRDYYQLEHLWADAPRVEWQRPEDKPASEAEPASSPATDRDEN